MSNNSLELKQFVNDIEFIENMNEKPNPPAMLGRIK